MVLNLTVVSAQATIGGHCDFIWSYSLHGDGTEKANEEKNSCQALKRAQNVFSIILLNWVVINLMFLSVVLLMDCWFLKTLKFLEMEIRLIPKYMYHKANSIYIIQNKCVCVYINFWNYLHKNSFLRNFGLVMTLYMWFSLVKHSQWIINSTIWSHFFCLLIWADLYRKDWIILT